MEQAKLLHSDSQFESWDAYMDHLFYTNDLPDLVTKVVNITHELETNKRIPNCEELDDLQAKVAQANRDLSDKLAEVATNCDGVVGLRAEEKEHAQILVRNALTERANTVLQIRKGTALCREKTNQGQDIA